MTRNHLVAISKSEGSGQSRRLLLCVILLSAPLHLVIYEALLEITHSVVT